MKGKRGGRNPGEKFGGRVKGTPNKATQDLLAKAEELGVDVFHTMLLYAKGDFKALGYPEFEVKGYSKDGDELLERTIAPELRAKMASDCAKYLYPVRRAVEHSGPEGAPINVNSSVNQVHVQAFADMLEGLNNESRPK